MNKILFFLAFMVAIGLSTGIYALAFHRAIDLIMFSIPWQLAGLIYLGGAIWLLAVALETRGN